MKTIRFIVISLILALLLCACGSEPQKRNKIVPFSFTDQNGQPFGSEELADEVWIADFIFTSCTTVCPSITMEMADLQQILKKEGIKAEFVSFTVDPAVDSAASLKEYILQFTDDEMNWHMLSGYTQEEIEIFAREQFQTIVQKPPTSDQVIHGTNFYLIDQQGFLINEYNFVDTSYSDELMSDIKKIQ